MFIVFEGLDGSGKSTQIKLLAEDFAARGERCLVTREPSDSNPAGLLARQAINGGCKLENETLALLFAADRYEHAFNEIMPALSKGGHVICDRYYYSNLAYQGNFERVSSYNNEVMRLAKPDIVFFIDVPPRECIRRITARGGDKGFYENIHSLNRVRDAFLDVFDKLKGTENIEIIPAGGLSEREVAEAVKTKI